MQVTDVRIRKLKKEGKMKAVISVTFDDEFVVHDIKLIEGENGYFVAMPSRKTAEGEFRDIVHPTNQDMRSRLESAIMAEYQKALALEESETEVTVEVTVSENSFSL